MSRDLLCFTHLRWDFVYQRPNHLMARAAAKRRVYYVEEPIDGPVPTLNVRRQAGLTIVVPVIPHALKGDTDATLRRLISQFVADERIVHPILWYYTPMPVAWTRHLPHSAVVYDVMDELSAFKFAPPQIRELEQSLVREADIVLTGGRQLYEARRGTHDNLHLFPSSVDINHFARARQALPDPDDQARIARPRIGYFGVIDERVDLELIRGLAERRPEWQIVMVGPVVKIDPADLPAAPNVHHLGLKGYADLPAYLSGWDVAIMPFAINDATRFISPTKTPEYLAGGRPVASTPITDVVTPYGANGLVEIGAGVDGFEAAVERALATDEDDLRRRADSYLASMSWDTTWSRIDSLITDAVTARSRARARAIPRQAASLGRGRRDPVGPRAYVK